MTVALAQPVEVRETGDYNFDGHIDYRQQSGQPGNQCGWWDYHLFDPDQGDYRPVDTVFCKEEFDSEKRLVLTRVNGGMAGLIYTARHFRWDGFELVATFAETQVFDSERRLFIRTRVTNIDSPAGPSVHSEILTPVEAGADPEMLD